MNKEEQIKRVEEIIELSYNILTQKLANESIKALNETSFQLEFGHILKTVGNLYEFRPEDKFHLEFEANVKLKSASIKSGTSNARVDLLIRYFNEDLETKVAIELKYFKKVNHREPNNRYDVFKDLHNLENYRDNDFDLCYFILLTDHKHYCYQEIYSEDTSDFDFRHGKKYISGTELVYKTQNPYGKNIILKNNYKFEWETIEKLNFLKLKL